MVRLSPFNSQIHVCVWCIYDSRSFRDDLDFIQTGVVNKEVVEILEQEIDKLVAGLEEEAVTSMVEGENLSLRYRDIDFVILQRHRTTRG